MTNIPYTKSETFTKDDIGFVIFPPIDPSDHYAYYNGVIEFARDKFGFEPNYDHLEYPRTMIEQPMIEFNYEVENPDIYADFIDTWNFLCDQCSSDVTVDFDGDIITYDGKLGLKIVAKE